MSHLELRRVMIRMLHDPDLVASIYADPQRALAGEEISEAELGWLLATPRAAWGTDPDRPGRVLAALLEEFPVTALLARERVATFFASSHFHGAVQGRGSLALALGEHLGRASDPLAATLARLETAIARVRRAPRRAPPSAPAHLRLAPHAALLTSPHGTLAAFGALRQRREPPALAAGEEEILVLRHPSTGEVTAEECPEGVAAIVRAAERPVPRERLAAIAREQGADPGEETAILDGLVRDGILC